MQSGLFCTILAKIINVDKIGYEKNIHCHPLGLLMLSPTKSQNVEQFAKRKCTGKRPGCSTWMFVLDTYLTWFSITY